MQKIIVVTLVLALACNAQILKLSLGKGQNCARPVNSQLAYVHDLIAPNHAPSPQPATQRCACGHHDVPVSPPIVPPVIPQACVKPAPVPLHPIDPVLPVIVKPAHKCRDEDDSDDDKGHACKHCGKQDKECKCDSCSCKDHKKHKDEHRDDKVKEVVKQKGKSCDKCKGGKCECSDCKCDACKGKPAVCPIHHH